MGGFKTYSDANPPQRGTAAKIYEALKARGYQVEDLHYNPNNWMKSLEQGWATWACSIYDEHEHFECWCGWDEERGAYLQGNGAPFAVVWLGKGVVDNEQITQVVRPGVGGGSPRGRGGSEDLVWGIDG